MDEYLSAGNKLFNSNWCNEQLIISYTTMSKDTSRCPWKDVSLFERGQIIGMHQVEKTSEEIAEMTKIALRTV